jgi:hypothetical protein
MTINVLPNNTAKRTQTRTSKEDRMMGKSDWTGHQGDR